MNTVHVFSLPTVSVKKKKPFGHVNMLRLNIAIASTRGLFFSNKAGIISANIQIRVQE